MNRVLFASACLALPFSAMAQPIGYTVQGLWGSETAPAPLQRSADYVRDTSWHRSRGVQAAAADFGRVRMSTQLTTELIRHDTWSGDGIGDSVAEVFADDLIVIGPRESNFQPISARLNLRLVLDTGISSQHPSITRNSIRASYAFGPGRYHGGYDGYIAFTNNQIHTIVGDAFSGITRHGRYEFDLSRDFGFTVGLPRSFRMFASTGVFTAVDGPYPITNNHASIDLFTPDGLPLFDLPEGFTLHSVALGIGDNPCLRFIDQPRLNQNLGVSDWYNSTSTSIYPRTYAAYAWQILDPAGSGVWLDISDGPLPLPADEAVTVFGTELDRLYLDRVWSNTPLTLTFRPVVTNSCGIHTGEPRTLRYCPPNVQYDDILDVFDVIEFWDIFEGRRHLPDYNHDGVNDFFDLLDFYDAFERGC
jgi:hypothetical protein